MRPSYILTEEEYNSLVNSEPNVFLEKHVQELEEELSKYKVFKKQMEEESTRLNDVVTKEDVQYPFHITEGKLYTTLDYFILIYNSTKGSTLLPADRLTYEYLNNLATTLGVEPEYANESELKRYRVSLQKQNICKVSKAGGTVSLIKL